MIRVLIFAVFGAGAAYASARWLVPWLGPMLLQPCPIPTAAGCVVWAVAIGLYGALSAVELNLKESKRKRFWGLK